MSTTNRGFLTRRSLTFLGAVFIEFTNALAVHLCALDEHSMSARISESVPFPVGL